MKKWFFVFWLITFVIGGLIVGFSGQWYPREFKVLYNKYNIANTDPLVYHIPTSQEIKALCYPNEHDSSIITETWLHCGFGPSNNSCLVDQNGKWYYNQRNLDWGEDRFLVCDLDYSKRYVSEWNQAEQEFFKKHHRTKMQAELLGKISFLRSIAWKKCLKREAIFAGYFLIISALILSLAFGIKKFYVKFNKKIMQFIKQTKPITYFLILASLATLALICIALKICL